MENTYNRSYFKCFLNQNEEQAVGNSFLSLSVSDFVSSAFSTPLAPFLQNAVLTHLLSVRGQAELYEVRGPPLAAAALHGYGSCEGYSRCFEAALQEMNTVLLERAFRLKEECGQRDPVPGECSGGKVSPAEALSSRIQHQLR